MILRSIKKYSFFTRYFSYLYHFHTSLLFMLTCKSSNARWLWNQLYQLKLHSTTVYYLLVNYKTQRDPMIIIIIDFIMKIKLRFLLSKWINKDIRNTGKNTLSVTFHEFLSNLRNRLIPWHSFIYNLTE